MTPEVPTEFDPDVVHVGELRTRAFLQFAGHTVGHRERSGDLGSTTRWTKMNDPGIPGIDVGDPTDAGVGLSDLSHFHQQIATHGCIEQNPSAPVNPTADHGQEAGDDQS